MYRYARFLCRPGAKHALKRYNLCREPVYNSNKGRSNKNSQSLDRKKNEKRRKDKTWTKIRSAILPPGITM